MLPDSKVLSLVFYKNDWHQREACAGCRRDEEHWSPQPGNSRKQPAAGRRILERRSDPCRNSEGKRRLRPLSILKCCRPPCAIQRP